MPLQPSFLDTVNKHYAGAVNDADFMVRPEEARLAINEWVDKATQGKICDVISPGVFDPNTRLVLVNAIYFKGPWLSQFEPENTSIEPFHLSNGGVTDVSMMYQMNSVRYIKGKDHQAVDLEYADGDLSMMILLPDDNLGLLALEQRLTAGLIRDSVDHMRERVVKLFVPKFRITWGKSMNEELSDLGMPMAFEPGKANFSGIDGHEPPSEDSLFIDDVFHDAFVEVDEAGTQAAAVTIMRMQRRGIRKNAPPPPPDISG